MPADEQPFLNVQRLSAETAGGATSPLTGLVTQPENAPPTSAKEWKARRQMGFSVTLPSGMTVHVRRTFDLLSNLKEGKIPNPLASMVEELIEGKIAGLNPNTMGSEAVGQMLRMFDKTLEAMMISPRFQARPDDAKWDWEPDDDAIGPVDVSLEDKVFLFQLSQGGTADLATFRQQSADIMASVSNGAEVPGPSE